MRAVHVGNALVINARNVAVALFFFGHNNQPKERGTVSHLSNSSGSIHYGHGGRDGQATHPRRFCPLIENRKPHSSVAKKGSIKNKANGFSSLFFANDFCCFSLSLSFLEFI